ncbi:MAG: hypothetical protein GY722_29150 [bacterium]|nr:hypothetical protein [bacterium]
MGHDTVTVATILTSEQVRLLDKLCHEYKKTRAEMLRELIGMAVQQDPKLWHSARKQRRKRCQKTK